MKLRSRLLIQTCLLTVMTGTGLVGAPAFAQTSTPVPLFLKQEAEQDAERQSERFRLIRMRFNPCRLALWMPKPLVRLTVHAAGLELICGTALHAEQQHN